MHIRRLLALAVPGLVLAALTACSAPPTPGGGTPVASVTISPASAAIGVGGTTTFTAIARDAGGNAVSGVTPVWHSSDLSVATIDAGGMATGVADGVSQITAVMGGVSSDPAALTVSSAGVDVSVVPTSVSAAQGGQASADVTVTRTGTGVGPAALDVTGSPLLASSPAADRIAFTFSNNPETGSGSVLTLDVGASVPTGSYALQVVATAGAASAVTPLSLSVTAPHTTLLVDDDGSTNNAGVDSTLSASDALFRALLSDAGVGYDVTVVSDTGDGPDLAALAPYTRVIWYTGSATSDVLHAADLTALQHYLDGGNRSVLVFSSNYLYSGFATWNDAGGDGLLTMLGAAGAEWDPCNVPDGFGGCNSYLADAPYGVSGVAATPTAGTSATLDPTATVNSYTGVIHTAAGLDSLLTVQAAPAMATSNSTVPIAVGRKQAGTAATSTLVFASFALGNVDEPAAGHAAALTLFEALLAY